MSRREVLENANVKIQRKKKYFKIINNKSLGIYQVRIKKIESIFNLRNNFILNL
jgi:hypothetical protein